MTDHIEKAMQQAEGRWPEILLSAGLPLDCLKGKPCPCPMCGGRDRFTYDNRRGCGDYICRHCGAGDGITLLCKYRSWSFREAFRHIEGITEGGPADTSMVMTEGNCLGRNYTRLEFKRRPDTTYDERQAMRTLWERGRQTTADDIVGRYLSSRSIGLSPRVINLRTFDRGQSGPPEMLARVQSIDGQPVQVHRTILQMRQTDPVSYDRVRKLMPGRHPPGCAVRLYEGRSHMGVAEGIETALSAATIFQLPVWAALTAGRLATFDPPDYVDILDVFADCDDNGAGQQAAERLVTHLKDRKIEVNVRMPPPSADWNDLLRGAMAGADFNPRQ